MATADNLQDDFLTCSVCMEVYQRPVTLTCQHSFCENCLGRYLQTKAEAVRNKSIPCPTCRQETPVPHPDRPVEEWAGQMKPSLLLTGLMDSIQQDPLKNEFRIVLVGKTGAGKSATRNTILGRERFESIPSSKSVTKYCEHGSTCLFGKYLQVVDAPGLQCNQLSNEESQKRIAQCLALLSPGIHAILFVIRIGRYTEEDVKVADEFIRIFGPESRNNVIAVFTGADDLNEKYALKRFFQEAESSLDTFLKGINNRYITVNNKASSERNNFVRNLLDKIEEVLKDNGGKFYTSEMFTNIEEMMKKVEAKKLKEIEERNREQNEKKIDEDLNGFISSFEQQNIEEATREKLTKAKITALRKAT